MRGRGKEIVREDNRKICIDRAQREIRTVSDRPLIATTNRRRHEQRVSAAKHASTALSEYWDGDFPQGVQCVTSLPNLTLEGGEDCGLVSLLFLEIVDYLSKRPVALKGRGKGLVGSRGGWEAERRCTS